MKLSSIKQYFPIFKNNSELVYLDNASTTQTPQTVLNAMNEYYTNYRSNIHRAIYDLSSKATTEYEKARETVAEFINANAEEIIFTPGTTYGLNMLCEILSPSLINTAHTSNKKNMLLSIAEHHANFIPWEQKSTRYEFPINIIPLNSDYEIDIEAAKKFIDQETQLISLSTISHVLGTKLPTTEIFNIYQEKDPFLATTILDVAQSIAHEKTDVKKLNPNFLVFSGHKLYGPTGIGILYGKKKELDVFDPFMFGGGMVNTINNRSEHYGNYDFTWKEIPHKFEAGTPPIAEVIGLAAGIKFLQKIGFDQIEEHEQNLLDYFFKHKPEYVTIIGPQTAQNRGSVISFTIHGIHPHDIAEILNRYHICVRGGHHCALPLMKYLEISGTTRLSFGIYNTTQDIDRLFKALDEVIKIFK